MKKQIALLLTIVMLVGIMGIVPVSATAWTPTSSDDGYTNVLADYDMSEEVSLPGIIATKLIKDEGFDATTIDTTQMSYDTAGTYTKEDVAERGKVLKQVGQNKTDYATSGVQKTVFQTATGVINNAKKVVAQIDVNIATRPPSTGYIDVLKVVQNSGATATTIRFAPKGSSASYIQVWKDGSTKTKADVQAYYTNTWYTVKIELDFTGDTNKLTAWIGDKKVADGVLPYGALGTSATSIKGIGFEMGWGETASSNRPDVLYDNFQIWTESGSVTDLSATDADYGKVTTLTSTDQTEYALLNPSLIDSEFTLSEPSVDKAIEFSQVKAEVDVKLTVENSDAGVGMYYVDSSGDAKYTELVDLSEYATGWHNVVVYVDAVNKKYTAYVDNEIKYNNTDISDSGFVAPRSLYVSCQNATVYADNMKYSVPENYDPYGRGIDQVIGTQKINDSGFSSTTINADEMANDTKGTYSVVSAAEEELNGAEVHGNVLKQVGKTETTDVTAIANNTAFLAKPTKAIAQVDVYVNARDFNYIDVFGVYATTPNGNSTFPTIRFDKETKNILAYTETNPDGVKVQSYYTRNWYTVTVEMDTVDHKYSAWINGKQVVNNETPAGNLATATDIRQMQLRMGYPKNDSASATAPVAYYDNYKVYVADTDGNLAVNGVEGSRFVETRQGANKYTLAYAMDGEVASEGLLIAATYDGNKTLKDVTFDRTETTLGQSDKKMLITCFEKSEGETLKKMLWNNFDAIKPIIPAQ